MSGITSFFQSIFGKKVGGILGGIVQVGFAAARAYGGGKAGGGSVMGNTDYLIGEKGPEILRMGSQGGSIVPNHKIGNAGGGIAHIVPSPYFNVVVDGRVVNGATPIAAAYTQQGVAASQRSGALRQRQALA